MVRRAAGDSLVVNFLWAARAALLLLNMICAEPELVLNYLEKINSNVDVSCGFQDNVGPTLWIINGSIYDLRKESHLFIVVDGIYTILIPEVNLCLNDTTFQCLSSNKHPAGIITQILVEPLSTESNRNSCNEANTANVLEINTQKLVNKDNFTKFELLIPETCTNTSHVSIHIYNQIGSTPRIVISLDNFSGQLPSQEVLTSRTTNSFIQLVGVENCSSRNNYYTFNDIPTNHSMIYSNKETVCYKFPFSTSLCDFDAMSLFLGISGDCNVLIDPPNYIDSFECYKQFGLFSINVNISSRSVCLSNWKSNFRATVVHFLCFSACPQQSCNIYNYVSSHKIVMVDGLQVNDTVIGDPLYSVPIHVPKEQLQALGFSHLSLCYELHGKSDKWFNLVTDKCISVNTHYTSLTDHLNIMDSVAVRAVDEENTCLNIRVNLNGCTATVGNTSLNMLRTYSSSGIMVQRYPNRVRISVPNCQDLNLVMWVICEQHTLSDDDAPDYNLTAKMIKLIILRGLNFDGQQAHGILGQFWNVPVSVVPYQGEVWNGSPGTDRYVVNITTRGKNRAYTGTINNLNWDHSMGPCLYVGDRQSGPVFEVQSPNDPVIESIYSDYLVKDPFLEADYKFGMFEEFRCTFN